MTESAADRKEREELERKESSGSINATERTRLNELKSKANQ